MKKQKRPALPIQRYDPSIEEGLSSVQVNERIEQNLTNTTKKRYSKSVWSILVGNICTFFNFLGLVVFVSLLFVGVPLTNYVFVLVYVTNILIGIVQELKAKRCIDRLSLISLKQSIVIRDGMQTEIPSRNIVLDDIIKLGIGSQIPTDSIILEGEIEVNESMLTGESVPVKKKVGDKLLSGSFISSGTCTVKAINVGKNNYIERLSSKAKKYKKPHSELMNSLKLFIRSIGIIILPIATVYMVKSTILADLKTSILKTSTVVIGMIPSGMFLLTSLALAVGIIKLAKHHTLVQDFYSLEMLARVDTICFDKTGTLTDGRMTVKEVVPLCETNISTDEVMSSMLGILKDNNQTSIALYNHFGQSVYFSHIKSLPFNSLRKFSAVTFEDKGTYAFGAPEFVLSEKIYGELQPQINHYATMGLRVLILAHSTKQIVDENAPTDFKPIALLLLVDNVRDDAIETVKWFNDKGVSIKVISGDNPITVAEVSKRVGIKDADRYISLEGLSNSEVYEAANHYTVFGRVSPEQKAILVKSLKASGHVTAMTGDGINDILALKEADCAVTVASGSDAARSVSNIVLLDNNFNSMPKVVFEGRRVVNNVQRAASLYIMKTLFTMILAVITLCLPYMNSYPFTLSQMNILELFVIGLPSFFLSLQPSEDRIQGNFVSNVLSKALPNALLMVLSVLIIETCKLSINMFDDSVYTTMQVITLTLTGTISLYTICKPLNNYRTILFFSTLAVVLGISVLCFIFGIPALALVEMYPLSTYWHHILIILCVILFDIPLSTGLQTLLSKVKFEPLKKHKDNEQ